MATSHPRGRRGAHRRGARELRPRRRAGHPRRDVRGARHRLARPRRAGADRRGRVRRRAQGRRHEGPEDGRRRDRARGGARVMSRRASSSPASAPSPRSGSARDVLLERWVAGESGIDDGEGALPRLRRRATTSPKKEIAPRRPLRAASRSSRATRRSRRRAGSEELPYASERIGCVLATGIGGLGSLEDQHDVLRDSGAEGRLAAVGPAAHGQRGRRPRCRCATACAASRFGVASACAAGAHAIGTAARMIQSATPTRSSPAAPRRR